MAIEMRKTEVLMDKPFHIGQAILDISKALMYEFWYDYLKPKYQDKIKLCYMDTDSFILNFQTEDFYKDIASDVDKWFDTSKYDQNNNRPLPMGKNKKIIGKFKDELNGKVMTEFIALRARTYSFRQKESIGHIFEEKKAEGTKKCVIKSNLHFELYKKALFNNETIRCTQQRFKSDHHKINTERVYKTALDNKDDKRIQSFDGITTYPIGIDLDIIKKSKSIIIERPIQLYY